MYAGIFLSQFSKKWAYIFKFDSFIPSNRTPSVSLERIMNIVSYCITIKLLSKYIIKNKILILLRCELILI